jgi:hypothetical protein
LETKSIGRLLSLLELGGQTALVRVYPLVEPSSTELFSGGSGLPQGGVSSPSPEASWHADLYIQAGQLQYCAILGAAGERRSVGQQALNYLAQMGGLAYELLPLPATAALPPPREAAAPFSPQSPGFVTPSGPPEKSFDAQQGEMAWFPGNPHSPASVWRPVRTRWGDVVAYSNAQRLTRDQRRILALINGQRSVDELSRLLGCPFEALSEALALFREQNLIS